MNFFESDDEEQDIEKVGFYEKSLSESSFIFPNCKTHIKNSACQ